ncbi:hypothetical protein ACOSQ4_031452 [Xanthoceras sorbifolium]
MPSRVLKFSTLSQVLLSFYATSRLILHIPLKVFRCSCFVHIHKQHRSKLDLKSLKCIFLDYSPTQKGYKCYSPSLRKFYYSMDVTFFEHQPFYPKTELQWENCNSQSLEPQVWDTNLVDYNHVSPSFSPRIIPYTESEYDPVTAEIPLVTQPAKQLEVIV